MKMNQSIDLVMTNLPIAISPDDVIYFESEYNEEVNRYLQMYYNEICANFKKRGYRFIYFPRLSNELLDEIFHSLYPDCPHLSSETLSLKSNFMQQFLPEEDREYNYGPSFFCLASPRFDPYIEEHTRDAEYDIRLYMIDDFDTIYEKEDLSGLIDEIESDIYEELHMGDYDLDKEQFPCYWPDDFYHDEKNIEDSENEVLDILKKSRSKKVRNLIEEINTKIAELNQCDRDYSVYSFHLRREIRPFTVVSNIRVDNRCRIELTDIGINMEFSAQMKALYLLYLNHPEGIHYLNVKECRDELLQWFRWCNPRNADEKIIDDLFVLKRNDRHPIVSLISRIKSEIDYNLGKNLGKNYYILHEGDGFYRINTTGYKVRFEQKNLAWKDMSPVVKKANL